MSNFLKLEGSAQEIGLKIGEILKNFLPSSVEIDKKRIDRFKKIIKEIAPYWLEEIKGISKATKIDENLIMMFNCQELKPNKFYMGNCTSFLIMNDRSSNKVPLLMKIRDEKPYMQIAGIKKINNTYRYIFGTNIGNMGIAHFLNEKLLAGANNTGSPLISGIFDIGLSDCHIMRIIAEKAGSCEEAIEILKNLILKGFVWNGGYKKGMIFLFADTKKGALVEMTAEKIWYRIVKKGAFVYANHFLSREMKSYIDAKREKEVPSESSKTRYKRGLDLIKNKRKIDVEYLKKISWDRKMFPFSLYNCSDYFPWRTVSVFVHYISSQNPYSSVSNRISKDRRFYRLKL